MTIHTLAALGKALSDPTRIRVVAGLRLSELCVCEIGDALKISQSTLSSHLQTLRRSGLVTTRKEHKWIYYALDPDALPLLEAFFAMNPRAKDFAEDTRRVRRRLKLRHRGACVLGFDQLDAKGGEKK
jgi:ArsR family transcriptional regulator